MGLVNALLYWSAQVIFERKSDVYRLFCYFMLSLRALRTWYELTDNRVYKYIQ